ncbi:hypothetical protein NMG60_11033990 [Bertholletia excelsa]
MEGSESVSSAGAGGSTPSNSRWNPTKEQINLLEGLYKQGIRTPTAEQIQQITSRLKAFGHIEGKNVFYWFQNHKARQRQKQKQESLAYFNHYLHRASPLFPPPRANVVCSPHYLQQNELGFYPKYPKVFIPGGVTWKQKPDRVDHMTACGAGGSASAPFMINGRSDHNGGIKGTHDCRQETLPLFPVEPTGILQARTSASSSLASTSAENPPSSSEITGVEEYATQDHQHQPFFDFFSGNGCCEGD